MGFEPTAPEGATVFKTAAIIYYGFVRLGQQCGNYSCPLSLPAEYSEQAQVAGRGGESAVVNRVEYRELVCFLSPRNAVVTKIRELIDQLSQRLLIQ